MTGVSRACCVRGNFAAYNTTKKLDGMKKITLLFNALDYRPGTLKFAAELAGLPESDVTALFIHDNSGVALAPELRVVAGQAYVEEIVLTDEEKAKNNAIKERNIAAFKSECSQYKTVCDVRVETGHPLDIISTWSRFSDVLVVSPLLTFRKDTHVPTEFIADLLPEAECPVMLCSEEQVHIKEVTLSYDGSKSAMYAIKHFFYLNPQYRECKVKVLRINDSGNPNESPTDNLFRDWMSVHCPSYSFVIMTGNASDVLLRYFLDNADNDKLLVTGAFGRGAVSRFFRRSTTDLVLKAADIPVFVAHT